MANDRLSSRSFSDRFVCPPSSQLHSRRTLRQILFSVFLSLLLFSTILGGWTFDVPTASAAKHPSAIPASLTLPTFLHEGRPDHVYHGPFHFPLHPHELPLSPHEHGPDYAHLPPSAEPATMKPISQILDATFLAGGANATPLDLVGSDQRLEAQVPPGAFDLSHASPTTKHATTTKHAATTGSVRLLITQAYGHFNVQIPSPGQLQHPACRRPQPASLQRAGAQTAHLSLPLPALGTDPTQAGPRHPRAYLAYPHCRRPSRPSTDYGFHRALAQ